MNVSDIVKYCLDAFNSINFVSTVLYIIVNCRQRPLVSYDDVKLWNKKKTELIKRAIEQVLSSLFLNVIA